MRNEINHSIDKREREREREPVNGFSCQVKFIEEISIVDDPMERDVHCASDRHKSSRRNKICHH
jgi:hypothetical protein